MTGSERPLRSDARRNRAAILDAASELFAQRGDNVQMEEIAARAGLGVGTLYRHFADKSALRAAIIGRRFDEAAELARSAETLEDPWAAFEALLVGYLESAAPDAAFRFAILSPEEPAWSAIRAEKAAFFAVAERIVERAVAAGRLRPDFRADDFVLISRGTMANMSGDGGWRRHLQLQLDGVRPEPRPAVHAAEPPAVTR